MASGINLQELLGLELGPRCCATLCGAGLISVALFIIGCIGAAGAFPPASMGWVTIGLAGGSFALYLAAGNLKDRKFDVIVLALMTAAYVTVGALGAAGILSVTQVGWGIIGTMLAAIPLKCIGSSVKVANALNS